MVVDTSAIFAILADEPEARDLATALESATLAYMSALNAYELNIAIARRYGAADVARVELALVRANIEIVPFDAQARTDATSAYLRFGKGQHPAQLNLADCAAYALAQRLDEPLLYKGNDFAKTDIRSALDEAAE